MCLSYFPYEFFLIWTSFCPTFIYYFDKTLNGHSKFITPVKIMSELRQYHPNLRVLQIKQTRNGWIFIGDTPKDFAILQSEPKMQQVLGKKVKMSLPKSYHSADAKKDKILIFKGVSNNITLEDFKQLLDFNKITHAEAERMK